MSTEDIYGLTFGLLVLTLITIVVVVVIWQGLASWRAIKVASREEVYRKLAQDLSDTTRTIRSQQDAILREIVELKAQGARVEKLLQQVE
jgi:cytoskeletal protein RodZ